MAKVLGHHQLISKKYRYLELPEKFKKSFGDVVRNLLMIVGGKPGNGKSNLLMQFLKALLDTNEGKGLYVSLEEGFEASIQKNVLRHLDESYAGKIEFADYTMTYDELDKKLSKRKSPQFIVIDSIQYWDIDYEKYKKLKEKHSRKSFIFISHSKGKSLDGVTAQKIEYDVSIKVIVEGYIAFIRSRYGGNEPYVIWEEGAKKYWGDKYENVAFGKAIKKKAKPTRKKQNNEETNIDK